MAKKPFTYRLMQLTLIALCLAVGAVADTWINFIFGLFLFSIAWDMNIMVERLISKDG